MKKINLQWIFSLLIVTALTGCGKKSSDSNANQEADSSGRTYINDGECVVPSIPPQQVIDNFIDDMKEVNNILNDKGIDKAKKKFDSACSEALLHFDCMSNEEWAEAYEYWVNVTNSPEIRNLHSFDFDTPTGEKFAKRIEDMRIEYDKKIMSLFGKTIYFTDKAGTRFSLHLYESEPDSCILYRIDGDESYSGTWKYQRKDLGISSIKINISDVNGFDEDWNVVDRGVNFGDAYDYYCSNSSFSPNSSSGEFYIVKGKIWPWFIRSDSFGGYEQFALPYTVSDGEPSGE